MNHRRKWKINIFFVPYSYFSIYRDVTLFPFTTYLIRLLAPSLHGKYKSCHKWKFLRHNENLDTNLLLLCLMPGIRRIGVESYAQSRSHPGNMQQIPAKSGNNIPVIKSLNHQKMQCLSIYSMKPHEKTGYTKRWTNLQFWNRRKLKKILTTALYFYYVQVPSTFIATFSTKICIK